MRTHPSVLLVALACASALAACGGGETSSGTAVEVANTINYGSFGTTTEIDCADGKSLNVGGSNNTLTVKGSCASVSVGGADNKIVVDRIDRELSVVGLHNTITYSDGSPAIHDAGSGNRINQG